MAKHSVQKFYIRQRKAVTKKIVTKWWQRKVCVTWLRIAFGGKGSFDMNLKIVIKIITFYLNFARKQSIEFHNVDSKEVSCKGNVFDFSVDYDAIDKSNILI